MTGMHVMLNLFQHLTQLLMKYSTFKRIEILKQVQDDWGIRNKFRMTEKFETSFRITRMHVMLNLFQHNPDARHTELVSASDTTHSRRLKCIHPLHGCILHSILNAGIHILISAVAH
jgi:hypothetical protein